MADYPLEPGAKRLRLLLDAFAGDVEAGAFARNNPGGQQAGIPPWTARIPPSATNELRRFIRDARECLDAMEGGPW